MIDELLKLLNEEQKKEIADKLTRKIEDAIDNYDADALNERIDGMFESTVEYVFDNADLDMERISALMTEVFVRFFKERLGVKE